MWGKTPGTEIDRTYQPASFRKGILAHIPVTGGIGLDFRPKQGACMGCLNSLLIREWSAVLR